jgi:hypothetical protein
MKVLKIIGVLFGVLAGLLVVATIYVGMAGPPLGVVTGSQLHKRHLAEIRSLELLAPDEQVRFFYSDALIDAKKGMYILTDRKLLLYSTEWDPPARSIGFDEVREIEVQYSTSWPDDSSVWLWLDSAQSGDVVWFPLSREGGGDRRFIKALHESMGAEVKLVETEPR